MPAIKARRIFATPWRRGACCTARVRSNRVGGRNRRLVWIPGQFGSLAAVPTTPGWSLGTIYYHTSVAASGNIAAAKEIQIGVFSPTVNVSLNANLNSPGDLLFLAPTYTFATPVLGGQFAVNMTGIFGQVNTSIAGPSARCDPLRVSG